MTVRFWNGLQSVCFCGRIQLCSIVAISRRESNNNEQRVHFNDSASRRISVACGHDLAPESLPHSDPPQISTCLTGGRLNPHRHSKTRPLTHPLSRALKKSIGSPLCIPGARRVTIGSRRAPPLSTPSYRELHASSLPSPFSKLLHVETSP